MAWDRRGNTAVMVSGWVEHETPRALLFHSDFMEQAEGIWIPKSQVLDRVAISGVNRWEIDVKFWIYSKNSWQ